MPIKAIAFLFFFIFSQSLFAVGPFDQFPCQVTSRYKDKQVEIDRGSEDGISKGDFVKFTDDKKKVVARGVAIQVQGQSSVFSFYRNYYGAFPPTKKLTLLGTKKYRLSKTEIERMELKVKVGTEEEATTSDNSSQEYSQSSENDYSSQYSYQENGYGEEESASIDHYIEEENSQEEDQYSYDPGKYSVNFGIEPYRTDRVNDEREIAYSAGVEKSGTITYGSSYRYSYTRQKYGNYSKNKTNNAFLRNNGKYEYNVDYSYNHNLNLVELSDGQGNMTKAEETSSEYNLNGSYDINRFYEKFSFFMNGSFYRNRQGNYYPTRAQYIVGILGIKYYIFENQQYIKKLSVSYIPVVDYGKYEFFYCENGQDDCENKVLGMSSETRLRHNVGFRLMAQFFDGKLNLENEFSYKPLHKIKDSNIDWKDSMLDNKLNIYWSLYENFSLNYNNTYSYDLSRKQNEDLPTSNMQQYFTLNYRKEF